MRTAVLAVMFGFSLMPIASPGRGRQTAQFTFTPGSPLIDERCQVRSTG